MKKSIAALAILVALGGTAFAQSNGMGDIDVRAGIETRYVPFFFTEEGDLTEINQTHHHMDVGAFLDLTFLRFQAAFGFLLSANADGGPALVDDYDRQYVDLQLLGKVPLLLADVSIWPAIGVAYNMVTRLNSDLDAENDVDDFGALNDFYVVAGLGADFEIAERFVITPSFTFGYNLTPNPNEGEPAEGVTFRQYRLTAGIGFGYSF
jgi:hypothetical protein